MLNVNTPWSCYAFSKCVRSSTFRFSTDYDSLLRKRAPHDGDLGMKTLKQAGWCLIFLMLSGCTAVKERITEPGQTTQSFNRNYAEVVAGSYLVSLPAGYDVEKKAWPLILFLHGAGERGDSLDLVKTHGPPKLIDEGRDLPFIVVSPQVKTDGWWDSVYLLALLDEVESRYAVDPERIYLTGLSMGGFGTWDLAMRAPGRFAAIAPICGGGRRYTACMLKDTPVWAFHGAQDRVIPLSASEEMVDAINACDGQAKLTVYSEAGHDSWTETYESQELYTWFLSHTRK